MAQVYQFLNPSEDDDWSAWQAYRQRATDFTTTTSNTGMAQNAAALSAQYPQMQPGVVLALAKANVKPGDPLAEQANMNSAQQAQQKVKGKSWFHSLFNATVRGGATALSYPFEELAGTVRTAHKAVEKHGVLGAFAAPFTDPEISVDAVNNQTTLGQIANAASQGKGVQTGSGFFVNPSSPVGQAQAQASRDAWMVDGHAATLGRVVAGAIFQPDTKPYQALSGTLDMAAALGLDPTNVAGGELTKFRNAKRLFQATDEGVLPTIKLSPRIGSKQLTAAGLINAERPVVAQDIAAEWLQSRAGRSVTERLADMSSPTDIRNAMKKKIDIDAARELADANTPEAVSDVLMREAVQGRMREKPYTNGIKAWKPVQNLGYQLSRRAEDIRLLTSLPGEKYLLNDPTQMVDQLDNTLKNANYKVEDARKWTDQLARADSPEQRRTIVFNAMADMAERLKTDRKPATPKPGSRARDITGQEYGTITGINKELGTAQLKYRDGSQVSLPLSQLVHQNDDAAGQAVNSLTKLYKKTTDSFNSYNLDDAGKEKGIEGLTIDGNGVSIPQPLLFSQLSSEAIPGLSRKQLVDIRRQTSAPGLSNILTSSKYSKVVDAARVLGNTWRDLTLIRGAYTLRVVGEEQLRLAANGLDSAFSFHPLSAIAWATGAKNPKLGDAEDVSTMLSKAPRRGTKDAWGRDWEQQIEEEGEFNKFAQAHMQAHGDKRWAMNTNFDGWIPVRKGDEKYAAGWSRELAQLHKDPLAARLAGGWREGDDTVRTGNDIEDAKEWFWNGKGKEYRLAHAERGGNWTQLYDDKATSDRYVEAINDMVTHKVANDPEIRDLIAYGMIGDKAATKNGVTDMLQAKAAQGLGPEMVRAHATDINPEKIGHYRNAVDHAFDLLISKPSNYLSRSTAFRQYYWQRMGELLPEMNRYAQAEALKNARDANVGNRVMNALYASQKRGAGALALEESDLLSKSHALDATKKLLYDLGSRSQFFDQAKIVMPFGEAWKEAITTWARAFSRSPHQMYRLKQAVDGAQGAGFFYTDENGNEVFNYPLSAQVSQWLTGTFTPFKGQVSGLNLAGNGLPGLGPVIQIGASELLKNRPNTPDWVRQFVLPTGDPDYSNGAIEAFFPGWAKRLYTAKFGDPNDSSSAFGKSVGRVMQYKMTTGQYDLSTETGMQQLQKDSIKSARLLYLLRAGSQFVAPTAPSFEWMAKDKEGHVTTAAKLMQDYRDMQHDPKIGYDNADEAFLAKYGDKALLYMQPLSDGGFSPTTELHDWVKQHPDVAAEFKDIYGYFAGDGGAYSNMEYERQQAMGERVGYKPREILELANNRVARLQYEQARQLVGDKPNAAGREFLSNLQSALVAQYPGYNPEGYTSKSTDYLITELQRALSTKKELADSDVGKSATDYLTLRAAVEQVMPGYKTAKKGAGARAALRQYGAGLAAANPDFSRMWSLFERELKDDTTTGGN
jgi:hypothetical protein